MVKDAYTIRVTKEVYYKLSSLGSSADSFNDVIKQLLAQCGHIIQEDDSKFKQILREKCPDIEEYIRALSALRYIYAGQEMTGTIGVLHQDGDELYFKEIKLLQSLDMVKEEHYSGKYGYGYRCTPEGNQKASEITREFLIENKENIIKILRKFDFDDLKTIFSVGFRITNTGHLSTRMTGLTSNSDEKVIELFNGIKSELRNGGFAVTHSDNSFTVLPPEFKDVLLAEGLWRF